MMMASPTRRPEGKAERRASPSRNRSAPTGSVLKPSSLHNEPTGSDAARPSSSGRSSPLKAFRKANKSASRPDVGLSVPKSKAQIDGQFEDLLTRLEVSKNIRSKLVALATSVKEDFLRRESDLTASSFGSLGGSGGSSSSAVPSSTSSSSPQKSRMPSTSSTDNLCPPDRRALFGGGPRSRSSTSLDYGAESASASRSASGQSSHSSASSSSSPGKKQRTQQGSASSPTLPSGSGIFNGGGERTPRARTKSGAGSALRSLSPSRAAASSNLAPANSATHHARHLLSVSSRKLDIDALKQLRVLLSSESPTWLGDFLFTNRGYEGLLKRIGELVEMEWREDIHDDKALHELLRGMTALAATDRGLVALSSLLFRPYVPQLPAGGTWGAGPAGALPETAPASFIGKEDTPPELPVGWELHPPFGPLVALLLSEKKPGELKTRKLLIDVLGSLLNLRFPPGLGEAAGDCLRDIREKRETSPCYQALSSSSSKATPLHLLLLLLHNPLQARSLSLLPFISMSHQSRPFKAYLGELLSVIRDYFWVFCHSDNKFWDHHALGEKGREERGGPSVPGGMTDGVEWEAMHYLTANLKLLNRISGSLKQADAEAARLFHEGLFDSGMERLLQTLRKASTRYYPLTHLAMAEYLALAAESRYKLPTSVIMRSEGGALRVDFELPSIPMRSSSPVRPVSPVRQASPTRQQQQQQQRPTEQRSSGPTMAAALASSQARTAPPTSISPTRSPAIRRSPSPSRKTRGEQLAFPPSPTRAAIACNTPLSPPRHDWLPPSTSSGSGSASTSAAEDMAAANAFLTTSTSDEAFFSQPMPAPPVGTSSADVYAKPQSGRQSPSNIGAAEPRSLASASASTPASASTGTLDTLASLELGAPLPTPRAAAAFSLDPSSGSGSGNGFFHRAPPGGMVPAMGTAKDRIRLWEGRATAAVSGSGHGSGAGR